MPERHAGELEQPKWRDDGGLGDVLHGHQDLQVAFAKVQLDENPAAIKAGSEVGQVGQRVFVFHRLRV